MRTALLLPGHLRAYKEAFSNQLKNIIKINNCDIFISTSILNMVWTGDCDYAVEKVEEESLRKEVGNLYGSSLKGIIIELEKEEEQMHPSPKQWIRLQQCNTLRKEYESKNKIRYDAIIRSRTDLLFGSPLKIGLDTLGDKQVSLFKHVDHKLPVHDQFSYGSSDAMDIYCNLIDVFLSREEGGRSEEQLYRWLNEQDINLNYINDNWFTMLRRFHISEG